MTQEAEPVHPTALVVGAGAIGSILAATLWRAGVPVEVLTKPAEAAADADRDGLLVSGVGLKEFTARPMVTADPEKLAELPECIFLTTKAVHVMDALEEIRPKLGRDSTLVVMQNGFCEDDVAAVVGRQRVISATVRWGATLKSTTASERTSAGGFAVGKLDASAEVRLRKVVALLEHCAPVEVTANVLGARYSKLVLNCCMTTLGAVSGLPLRGILALENGREMFLRVATEGVFLFRSLEVRLEKVDGLNLSWLSVRADKKWPRLRWLRARIALRLLSLLRGKIVSSSLQSLRRGEPTEIDYLNGYLVRKGEEIGLDLPANEHLVRLVKEIEAGDREIGPENLTLPSSEMSVR